MTRAAGASAETPRASIVVVTSVNAEGLRRCLESIPAQFSPDLPFETIVVLNGADGDVKQVAHDDRTGVKVVESLVNRGFAGGSNLGRSVAKGEFIVLLHDDAEAQAGWLTELVRCADEHPEAGGVGGRVLNPDGRLQLAGAVLWRDGSTTSVGPDQPDGYRERRPVDYTGSSSLLVRAATWDAVGGLDERFYPAYYVDVDLAMSIRRLGQIMLYEPRAITLHDKGASSSSLRFSSFVATRNSELFRAKWARELEKYEERSETLDRAFERTRREATRLLIAPPSLPALLPRSEPVGFADADRRFRRVDSELRELLAAELLDELAAVKAVSGKEEELAEVSAELERLQAPPSSAVEKTGFGARLLNLARTISHRGVPSRKG